MIIESSNVRPAHSASSEERGPSKDKRIVPQSSQVQRRSQAVTQAVAKRLKQARLAAGYESPRDFALAWQFNPTTYYHHENGRRAIKAEVAKRYAQLLKLPAGTLLYGEHLQSAVEVPILGHISAGGKVMLIDSQDPFNVTPVRLPDAEELVGYQIQGDELYPAYRSGDIVFHRKLGQYTGEAMSLLHGMECVVETREGTILLRQVMSQPDGRVTLTGYGVAPMFNVMLLTAAVVEIVQRALPAHLNII